MESQFWHQKWEKNEIGFHEPAPNPLLLSHFDSLSLKAGSRVFLPLCGKTLDIGWLLSQGYQVVGSELSELAIQQLFEELGVVPTMTQLGTLKQYHADNIDIFVGDIFELTEILLGKVDAIYDRAALVALPYTTRKHYTEHLIHITHRAPQLLICFEYDQSLMAGPPFSVSDDEVKSHYENHYEVSLIACPEMEGGLKGLQGVKEKVWLISVMN